MQYIKKQFSRSKSRIKRRTDASFTSSRKLLFVTTIQIKTCPLSIDGAVLIFIFLCPTIPTGTEYFAINLKIADFVELQNDFF